MSTTPRPVFTALATPRLRLRRFAAADLPALRHYRDDPEVARYQSWEGMSEQDAEDFLRAQEGLEPGTPGAWFAFAATTIPGDELVGDVALHVEAADPRLAEIGFTFSRAAQGRGLAAEAVGAVLRHAFAVFGLHRVKAVVDCANRPAVRLLERCGFRREAHFRQHAWFKGAWCDEYVYALLAEEWRRSDAGKPPG
jgi:aminoglycoside 6'-N-acetyltransferase